MTYVRHARSYCDHDFIQDMNDDDMLICTKCGWREYIF